MGKVYIAKKQQMNYCPSFTTIEMFGIDDLSQPKNISTRLEFPYIENELKWNGRAERIYPTVRFFANYFRITYRQRQGAFHNTLNFKYMVSIFLFVMFNHSHTNV